MVNIVKNILIMQNNLLHIQYELHQKKKQIAEETDDLIGNNIANKITSVSRN